MCLRDNLRVILMKPFRIGRTSNNSKKLKHWRPNGGLMLIYLANRLKSIVLSSQKRFHFVMRSLKHWILIKLPISLQAISWCLIWTWVLFFKNGCATLNRNISDSSNKESGFFLALWFLRGIIGDIKNGYYTLGFFRVEIVKWYNSNGNEIRRGWLWLRNYFLQFWW